MSARLQAIVTGDESPEDGPLSSALRARGIEPIVCPLVRALPARDLWPLEQAINQLPRYQWIAFTSARAVAVVAELCGGSLTGLAPRITCVGSATAQAVQEAGGTVALTPADARGAGLAEAMATAEDLAGKRILYPRAESARPDLSQGLRAAGALVDEPVAYRMEKVADHSELAKALDRSPGAALLLCSASAAEALAGSSIIEKLHNRTIGSMGPTTSAAVRSLDLQVAFEPQERTYAGLVEALIEHIIKPQISQMSADK